LAIIIGFIAIGALLHVVPLYAGFLFLWYWTSVTHSSPAALAPAMIGSLVGAGLSYMLQTGTATGNAPLALGALGLMIMALFLVIAGRLPTFCNAATMLYVTVFNAPILQAARISGKSFSQRCSASYGSVPRSWARSGSPRGRAVPNRRKPNSGNRSVPA
jgi:hypothetical protein